MMAIHWSVMTSSFGETQTTIRRACMVVVRLLVMMMVGYGWLTMAQLGG